MFITGKFIRNPKDDVEIFINDFLSSIMPITRSDTIEDIESRAAYVSRALSIERSYYFAKTIQLYKGSGTVGFLLPTFDCVYVNDDGEFYTPQGKTEVKKGKRVYCLLEDKAPEDLIAWAKSRIRYGLVYGNEDDRYYQRTDLPDPRIPISRVYEIVETAFNKKYSDFGFQFTALY